MDGVGIGMTPPKVPDTPTALPESYSLPQSCLSSLPVTGRHRPFLDDPLGDSISMASVRPMVWTATFVFPASLALCL